MTLSDENITTLYVYDIAGHKATVSLTPDTQAPTATPTYSQGNITIDVGDTCDGTNAGVGIAQVGDDTASYTSYPTAATSVPVDTGTESVDLVDALGNDGSVAIDYTAPTATRGYYKGTTGVLTVHDTPGEQDEAQSSGLWKIAKADGTALQAVTQADRLTFEIGQDDIQLLVLVQPQILLSDNFP